MIRKSYLLLLLLGFTHLSVKAPQDNWFLPELIGFAFAYGNLQKRDVRFDWMRALAQTSIGSGAIDFLGGDDSELAAIKLAGEVLGVAGANFLMPGTPSTALQHTVDDAASAVFSVSGAIAVEQGLKLKLAERHEKSKHLGPFALAVGGIIAGRVLTAKMRDGKLVFDEGEISQRRDQKS